MRTTPIGFLDPQLVPQIVFFSTPEKKKIVLNEVTISSVQDSLKNSILYFLNNHLPSEILTVNLHFENQLTVILPKNQNYQFKDLMCSKRNFRFKNIYW